MNKLLCKILIMKFKCALHNESYKANIRYVSNVRQGIRYGLVLHKCVFWVLESVNGYLYRFIVIIQRSVCSNALYLHLYTYFAEVIHHGKILKSNATLQDSGVKNGEMVHIVKKKQEEATLPKVTYTDAELQSLNSALRSLGCTPNAPGWTRAMQVSTSSCKQYYTNLLTNTNLIIC